MVPCYDQGENVTALYGRVWEVLAPLTEHTLEFVFIDHCSTDGTVAEPGARRLPPWDSE